MSPPAGTPRPLRILAVDTTTPRSSVALLEGEEVLGEFRLVSERHSAHLLPAVALLLEGRGLSALDVDAFAVATGPGSFTGLRVGISTVQGLAVGAGRPCVGVTALDALGAEGAGSAPRVVAVMDAFRGGVYAGHYDREGRPLGPGVLEPLQDFLEAAPEGAAFLGDGALRYREEIAARRPGAVFPGASLFLAARVGRLALAVLSAGGGQSADSLRPFYLRGADIRPPRP